MSLATKILTTTVLGAGAYAGWTYLKNLKTAGAELVVVPKASIHSLSWNGLTIRLDVLLKNPSNGSFSLIAPFLKLLYKDTVIGSSTPLNKEFKLPAHGELMIDNIMVQIPMSNVFSMAFTLIKTLIGGGTEIITVRTMTTINLGIIKLPYENKQDITIKK
ncbi:hypothetical protein [Flavisolibacter nicotianae]|uniref:hypothetical protein n=1 Tax=Flavisolibacter nicotianae TaxID=2364882 RepID=UPI000EB11132|nr:hypothetical protein [Flavisolibacter nicotianae]